MASGAAIELPSGSILDCQGFAPINTYGPNNTAIGIHAAAGRANVTVKNHGPNGRGFMYCIWLESGTDYRVLDSQVEGYFRGVRVEGQRFAIRNVLAKNVGGCTYPNFTFAFGIEMYGAGICVDCRAWNIFAVPGFEAVPFSVSDANGVVMLQNLLAINPEIRPKSIGVWTGITNVQGIVLHDNITVINFERYLDRSGSANWRRNCRSINCTYDYDANANGIDVDLGGNVYIPPFTPPPPPQDNFVPLIPTMSNQGPQNGITLTDNSIGGNNAGFRMVDGDLTSPCAQWDNGTGAGYLIVDFSAPVLLKKWTLGARVEASAQLYAPKSRVLEGWNGLAWDVLLNITNEAAWSVGETRESLLSTQTSYARYRMNVLSSQSGFHLQIALFQLYGASP